MEEMCNKIKVCVRSKLAKIINNNNLSDYNVFMWIYVVMCLYEYIYIYIYNIYNIYNIYKLKRIKWDLKIIISYDNNKIFIAELVFTYDKLQIKCKKSCLDFV